MADLLTLALRGPTCAEIVMVTGADGARVGHLQCSLKPGHAGPLHYDGVDLIWWAADGA